MKHIHNSSFLTQQTRYSQELFAKSINRVRKRINILSTSAITQPAITESKSIKGNASGLCATLAKLTFQAEILEQDIKYELLDLRKTKQTIAIIAEDLRKRSHRVQQQMRFEVQQLRQEVDRHRETALLRGRKLAIECQMRRQKGEILRQRLQQAGRRVSALQISLGCYTGLQKFDQR